MLAFSKGRYAARLAEAASDIDRAQALRHLSFRARRGLALSEGRDCDAFDAQCRHMLVEEVESGDLVGCYRLMPLANGLQIHRSYSAQFYDLTRLSAFSGPMVEMGRFCLHPERHDPDILRLAWGAMTRFVDLSGTQMMFGCSSFDGASGAGHAEALALLRARHLAPERWSPGVKARAILRFADVVAEHPADQPACRAQAMLQMPPLLRSYLAMAGWVSDHAVVDRDLDTLHVFTAVEVASIPAGRARALRALAGEAAIR